MKRLLLFIFFLTGIGTAFGQGAPGGNALNFDGNNDYVATIGRPVDLNTGSFTIETWIRTTSVSAGIYNYSNGNTVWEAGEKSFFIDASGNPTFVGNSKDFIFSNKAVNDGIWHHIAVTYDQPGNTGKMYVDGIDRTAGGSFSISSQPDFGTASFGNPNYQPTEAPNYLNGSLDQFRIWNVARTAAEVSANYQRVNPLTTTGLVANYSFENGNAGGNSAGANTLYDLVGSNNGTLTNFALNGATSNWVRSVAVVPPGNELSFLSPNNVSIPNSASLNSGTITLEAWIKPNSPNARVIVKRLNRGSYDEQFALTMLGNKFLGTMSGSVASLANQKSVSQNGTFVQGRWYHVAVVYNATAISLYVDGIFQNSTPTGFPVYTGLQEDLYFNFQNLGAFDLDEVSIFNTDRSADIEADKQNGVTTATPGIVAYYKFDQGLANQNNTGVTTVYDETANANNGTLNSFNLNGTNSNWVGSYATVMLTATAAAVSNSGFTANWTAPAGTVASYTLEYGTDATFASGVTPINNITTTSQAVTDLKPGSTYYYRVRAVNGTDVGPNSNVITATLPSLTPPGNALNLGGTADYVTVGTATTYNALTMKTFEAWVKFKDFAGIQEIISKSEGSKGLELLIYNGNLCVYAMGSGPDPFINYSTGNLQANKWYHVAVTQNGAGSTMNLYVNGVVVGTNTTSSGMVNSTFPLTFGRWMADASRDFTGTLDEVRIWNVVRTAAQIQANMNVVLPGNTANLTGYFNFDHGTAGATNTGIVTAYNQATGSVNGVLTNAVLTGTTSNWVGSYAMVVPTATTAAVTNSSFTANWNVPALGTVGTYSLDYTTDANFN